MMPTFAWWRALFWWTVATTVCSISSISLADTNKLNRLDEAGPTTSSRRGLRWRLTSCPRTIWRKFKEWLGYTPKSDNREQEREEKEPLPSTTDANGHHVGGNVDGLWKKGTQGTPDASKEKHSVEGLRTALRMSHTHRGDENTYTQRNPTPLSVVRDPAPSLPEAKVYSAHKGGSRPETLPRSADPATPPPQIASTPAPAPTVSKEKIPFAPTDTSWRSSKYTLEEASQTPTKWEESPVGSPSYPASPAETPSGEKEQWEQPDESDVGETTDEWGRELDALKADEESQTGFDESGQAGDTESERDRIGDGLGNMGKSIQPLVEEAYPDMKLSDEPSPPPVGRHDSEIAATRNFRRQWAPRRYQFGPGETPLPTPPGGSDIDLDNENVIWGELKFQVQDSVADRGRGTPVFAFGHRDPQLMNPEPRKLLQQTTAGAGVPDDGRLECADNHGGSRVGDGVLRANVDDVRDTVAGGTPQQEERYRRGHGAQKGCTQLRTNESDFFQAAAARFQRKDHLSQGLVSPATRTVPLPDSAGAGRLQDEERSTTARILGGPWLFFNADEE